MQKEGKHINQSSLIKGFTISDEQKEDLITFLHTLTDQLFLRDRE